MKIYTKEGDKGVSSTINKTSISKSEPVFAVLGTLDELTCQLGVAKQAADDTMLKIIETIQTDIIALCGQIAGGKVFVTKQKTEDIEHIIDNIQKNVKSNTDFVLPGATKLGGALHTARAVARRAEREAVAASWAGGVNHDILAYLNRMSDLFYMLAVLADSTSSQQPCQEGFLNTAQNICNKTIEKAREIGVKAVVAVADSAGDLVAIARDDGAFTASVDIAINKAYTSASLKMTTKKLGELAQPGADLYGIQFTNQGRIVIFGGGTPLTSGGKIVGAAGVSGGSSEQDHQLCEYAKRVFEGDE